MNTEILWIALWLIVTVLNALVGWYQTRIVGDSTAGGLSFLFASLTLIAAIVEAFRMELRK